MNPKKTLLLGVVAVLVLVTAQPSSAIISRNTFAPEGSAEAQLLNNGRQLVVTALIACTAGERLTVEATITQEHTGAYARGETQTVCEDVDLDDPTAFQEITFRINTRGAARFEAGHAVATGLALSWDRGRVTSARQWQPGAGIEILQ